MLNTRTATVLKMGMKNITEEEQTRKCRIDSSRTQTLLVE